MGPGLNGGVPACFFSLIFVFLLFFCSFFARFFRDDSLMEDRMRSALPTSKTLVPPESKHPNVQSELRQQTII